jgi:hypothetical protein
MSVLIICLVFMGCTGKDEIANDKENNDGEEDGDAVENVLPHASMWFPKSVFVGQSVKFDGSASYDPDDDVDNNKTIDGSEVDNLTYKWDFGDGNNDTGKVVYHTFEFASYLRILLRITDDDGGQDAEYDYINVDEDTDDETQMTAPEANLTCRKIDNIPGIVKYIVTVSSVTGNNTGIVNMNYTIIDGDSEVVLVNGTLYDASQGSENGVAFATFDQYLTEGDFFTISPENIPGLDDGDLFRIDFIPNGEVVGACLLGTGGL